MEYIYRLTKNEGITAYHTYSVSKLFYNRRTNQGTEKEGLPEERKNEMPARAQMTSKQSPVIIKHAGKATM